MTKVHSPKKLIEVALPLKDINTAAAREKSIRHGHPNTLHLWWSRKPLAAARAVIFAQMVNDPGYQQGGGFKRGVNKKDAAVKREKLFEIIRELVQWENLNDGEVLGRARAAIEESWRETCHLNRGHPQAAELFNPEQLPALHDPFAGGGAIPLEAQRLGLASHASELNPVAAMINKAMIEIPPKFSGRTPVGPIPEGEARQGVTAGWTGNHGLAEDVRRYGHWMREEAVKRIGHLYPKVAVTDAMIAERPDLRPYAGQELTVVAWLWARTVKSPSPAFSHVDVPLVPSFVLSRKAGKEAWAQPMVEGDSYRFTVKTGPLPANASKGTQTARGANFRCVVSGAPLDRRHIIAEAKAGRMGAALMAVVVAGRRSRIYLSPTTAMEMVAQSANATNVPETKLPDQALDLRVQAYGMSRYRNLFTPRQLAALTTFSDLVQEARARAIADAKTAGMPDDGLGIDAGGIGATAYGDAMSVYLAFAVDKGADHWSSLCSWDAGRDHAGNVFGRQALSMMWDYAEVNPMSHSAGSWLNFIRKICQAVENFPAGDHTALPIFLGQASQADAQSQSMSQNKLISTDPPYYDNIAYADLSDFFYVWMRRSLKSVYPNLFATMATPKTEELIASRARHGGKEKAEIFFMSGMTRAIRNIAKQSHPAFPVSIYYAFKQSETKEGDTSSTGWVTFLEAVIQAGLAIHGTWPMRTELSSRLGKMAFNALNSSIVLACRQRGASAETVSRRQFQRELRKQMPEALDAMTGERTETTPVAPVDLAQATIGPGMAIFSQYASVLGADGKKTSVQEALTMINRSISDYLSPGSGNFDKDTLFCDDWFSQCGWSAGDFGEADTLARAKGTSVEGVQDAGVIKSKGGKVRLLKWKEYPERWNPASDKRTPEWEACHHMIRALNQQGEVAAGALLAGMPGLGEAIRRLAYHLYTVCERKQWADDARAYNELIDSWTAIVDASHDIAPRDPQGGLDY